ncbi:hypothetical protein [Piscinibacter terrae]|uniref:Uncharacterized protein n=1 Tax=Piscinibacter terrae TaxID=2496871 RepID=A0A3N7HUP5_9BURK|nr:hypothetical protein [Albitalea terrae]RQP25036.1 hypothetical protein DZC73_09280 [Albitalea terrae]
MKPFIERLKSMLSAPKPAADPPSAGDPLNYDQFIHLDAEDLAEQGIAAAYRELTPQLLQYTRSPIEVTEEIDSDSGSYAVRAAELRFPIWGRGTSNRDGWQRATVAFFALVNANLKNSSHKFYALYGGNDLGGLFLTEEEFAAARQAIKKQSEWPWVPVDEPPHYGCPN